MRKADWKGSFSADINDRNDHFTEASATLHTLFPEEEALCTVVSRSDQRKLKTGKLTKAAFLASSELFLSDKDMKEGFRKTN